MDKPLSAAPYSALLAVGLYPALSRNVATSLFNVRTTAGGIVTFLLASLPIKLRLANAVRCAVLLPNDCSENSLNILFKKFFLFPLQSSQNSFG